MPIAPESNAISHADRTMIRRHITVQVAIIAVVACAGLFRVFFLP